MLACTLCARSPRLGPSTEVPALSDGMPATAHQLERSAGAALPPYWDLFDIGNVAIILGSGIANAIAGRVLDPLMERRPNRFIVGAARFD